MRDDNCLFCKIVGGDIPSNKRYPACGKDVNHWHT